MSMPAAPRGLRSPAELVAAAELGDDAKRCLAPGASHQQFLDALVARGLLPEAHRFLAFCLPRREGVWWAWVTARRSAGAEPPPRIRAALEATERWIAQPSDANRRAAFQQAQEAELGTAAGCAGLAAFLAGDSLAPADQPVVPPGEFEAAKAIAGAVLLAAVASQPEKAPEKLLASYAQGLEVVRKINLWPE